MVKTKEQDYEEERGQIEVMRLDSVPNETLEWLWKGRLPCGKFTLLDGDPSLGKSTMVCDLVARITTGRPMPDEEQGREPASVLMVCGEDGVADTIRPRLEAAGADLSKVYVAGANRSIELPDDIDLLKAEVSRCSAALVVIDPIIATLGKSASNDSKVREALQPLVNMAAETKATVLGIRHLTKAGGKNVIYRGGGSIGIIGLARSALLLARDPDDPNARVLAVAKSNLASKAASVKFRFEGTPSGYARIQWVGTSEHDGERLLAAPGDPEKRGALEEAVQVLEDILKDGPVPVNEIRKRSTEAGAAWATMRRAQVRLQVVAIKEGFGSNSKWVWQLPEGAYQHGVSALGDGNDAPEKSVPGGEDAHAHEGAPVEGPAQVVSTLEPTSELAPVVKDAA